MRKQIIDQSAHFIVAVIVLLPVALCPNILSFAFASGCIGLVREFTEGDPIFSGGSMLDILFWTLGGAFVGALHDGVIQ